ncbi:MAG: bifunctional metallophosphatase/5'-nucleotidase, partial [Desulfamplus sp.]|nr:bifunctional metallophosphatase/5'-nucleotidase [Desulfamplus sp.]
MNRQQIYVDMDDVICSTTENYTWIAQQEFGKTVAYEAITSFNLQQSFQLTDSEYDHFFSTIHRPEVLMSFKPVENAITTLKKWSTRGYDIEVVTGRPSSTRDTSIDWLKRSCVPFQVFPMVVKYNR